MCKDTSVLSLASPLQDPTFSQLPRRFLGTSPQLPWGEAPHLGMSCTLDVCAHFSGQPRPTPGNRLLSALANFPCCHSHTQKAASSLMLFSHPWPRTFLRKVFFMHVSVCFFPPKITGTLKIISHYGMIDFCP